MSQVAREARLAKGTLYLYFDTKEELFLALLTDHLRTWLQELHTLLQERRPQQPTEITATLLQSIQGKENLRRLLLLLNTVLARRLSPQTLLNFRRDLRHLYEAVLPLLPCRAAGSTSQTTTPFLVTPPPIGPMKGLSPTTSSSRWPSKQPSSV